MTIASVTALVVAVAGLVTAVTALYHALTARSQLASRQGSHAAGSSASQQRSQQ